MGKPEKSKRGAGRPTDSAVGREAVLETATRLLRELPPARVTVSLVAREAGVDPALVRYYFGDRSSLLLAVVDRMILSLPSQQSAGQDGAAALEARITDASRFTRSAKNMHRLMVDELSDAKSADVRDRLRAMNLRALDLFDDLFRRDGGEELRRVDPLFLHLMLIGIFDFFVSAQPVVRNIAPKEADMEDLASAFEAFVIDVVLNGIRKR
jgi:AcrR family transcriptional regulator